MAFYYFKDDLHEGKNAENECIEILAKKMNLSLAHFKKNNTYAYDFEIIPLGITIEVKHDVMAVKTGNIAIEYECRGNASGINTSLAHYWVYKIGQQFYIIELQKLKNILDDEKNIYKKVTGGDKGSETKMWLIKESIFKLHSILL